MDRESTQGSSADVFSAKRDRIRRSAEFAGPECSANPWKVSCNPSKQSAQKAERELSAPQRQSNFLYKTPFEQIAETCECVRTCSKQSMSGFVDQILHQVLAFQQTLLDLGWIGVLAYALFIAIFQMTLAPISPAAIAGGLMLGLGRGFAAVTIGTALGAALNFLLARHGARRLFERRLKNHEKFRLIDDAIGREGWKIVALLRFCPVPFGLANFCYGLTAIAFWPYLAATAAAIVPGNFFFSYLGSTAQQGLQAMTGASHHRHPGEYVILGVGLLATFLALTYVGKIARAALTKSQVQAEPAHA
jgi:uncharacterized membrane protein YdjX (TVP38/TMEM64 family)